MRKSRDIKALFEGGSERLTSLKHRLQERSQVLDHVIAALPEEIAANVTSAGIEDGELIIGAVNAAWATRLRYTTDILRQRVSDGLGMKITGIRVKVTSARKR